MANTVWALKNEWGAQVTGDLTPANTGWALQKKWGAQATCDLTLANTAWAFQYFFTVLKNFMK